MHRMHRMHPALEATFGHYWTLYFRTFPLNCVAQRFKTACQNASEVNRMLNTLTDLAPTPLAMSSLARGQNVRLFVIWYIFDLILVFVF